MMQKIYALKNYWLNKKSCKFTNSKEICEAIYPNEEVIELDVSENSQGNFYGAIKENKIFHIFQSEIQVKMCFPDFGNRFLNEGGKILRLIFFNLNEGDLNERTKRPIYDICCSKKF